MVTSSILIKETVNVNYCIFVSRRSDEFRESDELLSSDKFQQRAVEG